MVDYQTNDGLIITWLTSSIIDAEDLFILKNVISDVRTFESVDSFADFITDMLPQQKVIWIISNSSALSIITVLHDFPVIHSIYIHNTNENNFNKQFYQYRKVIGIFIDIQSIRDALNKNLMKIEKESTSISTLYYNSFDSLSEQSNSKKLDSSFMFTRVLKKIILKTNFEQKEKKQLLDYLRNRYADNTATLNVINEFECTYTQHSPAWWLVYNLHSFYFLVEMKTRMLYSRYTRDTFIYRLLNYALRLQDVEVI